MSPLSARVPPTVIRIANAVSEATGTALIVGGWIRDHLLQRAPADLDVEIHGIPEPRLIAVLEKFGTVRPKGASFPTWTIDGVDAGFALPRTEISTGPRHADFAPSANHLLSVPEASRRRDLTVNAIALDPLTGHLHDSHGGIRDLPTRTLRAVDPGTFGDDPLRALRVPQLAARLHMTPDAELLRLCAAQDLSLVSCERTGPEIAKLLLAPKPSTGLRILAETHMLRWFPQLDALRNTPQDPIWHPEGDVWTHTCMVVDQAARLRSPSGTPEDDRVLMLAALCHDLGKPSTTHTMNGRTRAPGHARAGLAPASRLLRQFSISRATTRAVSGLVLHHMAPVLYVTQGANPAAYRRLARKLHDAGTTPEMLATLSRADTLGRGASLHPPAATEHPEQFLRNMHAHVPDTSALQPVVLGRHLISRGLKPGPQFSPILERCRQIQEQTGCTDPLHILNTLASEDSSAGSLLRHQPR